MRSERLGLSTHIQDGINDDIVPLWIFHISQPNMYCLWLYMVKSRQYRGDGCRIWAFSVFKANF